ncbi:hypothetical protein BH10PSE13_BH10PSE13_09210 [soil metagenome]
MRTVMTATVAAAALCLAAPTISLAEDDAPVKVSGSKDAARGVTQVTIGALNIGFIFESIDQTKASGGMMGAFGGTTKAKSTLVGVTPEMMQKIADAAYADLSAQLTAQGYTVVDTVTAFAHPDMAKLKSQAIPLDINIALEKGSKGKATYFKPAALPVLVMMPGDFVGSGMSSIGLNMASASTSMAFNSYAKDSGVGVIDATYLIDFSETKRPGAFSFGGLKVNSGLSVTADFSRLSLVSPAGKVTTLIVNDPVGVEGEFIDQADASSGFDKTSQAAGNVAGGLMAAAGFGGLRFGKTRKFEFTAKPGNYEEGAAKAGSLTNERLVGQLMALR